MAMVLESTDRSQRFPLDRESMFVGSSERKSDICLTSSDVAAVHCELTLQDHGIRVVAMTESGVTVNGKTVREATLSSGDELGIASLRFRLTGQADCESSESKNDDVPGASDQPVATQLSRWVVQMSGMNLGPLDWDELQTMISRGEVRLDDQVQRENDSKWETVRDVLPQSGGDALLCDDPPSESYDETLRRPRSRRKSSRSRDAFEVSSATAAAAELPDDIQEPTEAPIEVKKPLAPQFFIMRGGDEVGPLPRQAIQELADDGSLQADTPVRLEDSTEWSTAAAVGLHCSAVGPDAVDDRAASSGREVPGGVAWLVFAPYYFVVGLVRSVASLEPRRLAKWSAIVLVIGAVTFGWYRSWSQTAMRGVITLDGEPVAEVLVQLTGAGTGDSAMGITGSDGSFRVMTLDGELKPGLYLVTVRPVAEFEGNRRSDTVASETEPGSTSESPTHDSDLPERYRHINTTDATIEITADQSRYSVELTTQPPSGASGFRDGDRSAAHALQ
jgi:hypothetical protein